MAGSILPAWIAVIITWVLDFIVPLLFGCPYSFGYHCWGPSLWPCNVFASTLVPFASWLMLKKTLRHQSIRPFLEIHNFRAYKTYHHTWASLHRDWLSIRGSVFWCNARNRLCSLKKACWASRKDIFKVIFWTKSKYYRVW